MGHGDTRLRSPAMIIVFEKKRRRKVFYSDTTTNSISMGCAWQIDLYKDNDTFETKFTRHVSAVQRPSSVEVEFYFQLMMVVERPKHVL